MRKSSAAYDVFLSYSKRDLSVVRRVRTDLAELGLSYYHSPTSLAKSESWSNELRIAIAEAHVFVVALGDMPHRWLALEMGAALAWGKAIVVVYDAGGKRYLEELPAIAELVRVPVGSFSKTIRRMVAGVSSDKSFTEEEREVLISLYRREGASIDSLISNPVRLMTLTNRFNHLAHASEREESVAKELLRLRKSGLLSVKRD